MSSRARETKMSPNLKRASIGRIRLIHAENVAYLFSRQSGPFSSGSQQYHPNPLKNTLDIVPRLYTVMVRSCVKLYVEFFRTVTGPYLSFRFQTFLGRFFKNVSSFVERIAIALSRFFFGNVQIGTSLRPVGMCTNLTAVSCSRSVRRRP